MGFKDLFFTVEPTDEAEVKPVDGKSSTPAPVQPTPVTALPLPTGITAGVNPEMLEILNKAVQDANLEGFDYLEFNQVLTGYGDIPMTEQQKYESVFRTAKVMGVTVESLVSSIDTYIGVLVKQREGFMANMEIAVKEQIVDRNEDVAKSEKVIADALNEINRLNELVVCTQKEVLAKKNEIAQNQQQIDMTNASFEATYNVVVGRLNEDKTKMITFLKK